MIPGWISFLAANASLRNIIDVLTSREDSQERNIIDVSTSRVESQEPRLIDVLTSRGESQECNIIDVSASREESQERNIIGRHGKNITMPPPPTTPHPTPLPAETKRKKEDHPKTHDSARLPMKMQRAFLATSQNTAPATQDGRAQIHWWLQVEMHNFQLEIRKKRVWPAREANFARDE